MTIDGWYDAALFIASRGNWLSRKMKVASFIDPNGIYMHCLILRSSAATNDYAVFAYSSGYDDNNGDG